MNKPLVSARRVPVACTLRIAGLAVLAFAAAAAGCGGGGSTPPPVVSNKSITTSPTPLTFAGGSATISANVTDPTGVVPGSVKVDVINNQTGASVIQGPQPMSATTPGGSTYTYQVNLANNALGASAVTYSVTITATNKANVTINPPQELGTVTVPVPQPAPKPPTG